MLGNLGFPELVLILIIALLVFGPEKLPELVKSAVKTVRTIKKEMADVRKTIEDEIGDITEDIDDVKRDLIIAGDLVEESEVEEDKQKDMEADGKIREGKEEKNKG